MHEKADIPMLDPGTLVPSLNPILITDGAGLEKGRKYLERLRGGEFVHDFEFNLVDGYYQRRARTWQFGDRNEQYIIDFLAFVDGDSDKLWAGQGEYRGLLLNKDRSDIKLRKWRNGRGWLTEKRAEEGFDLVDLNPATFAPIYDLMQPVMDSDEWLKIAHFAEAEYVTAKWCLGIRTWNIYDTFLAERLIYNGAPVPKKDFYGLSDLVSRYFGFRLNKEHQTTFNLTDPITEEQIIYCALDIRMPQGVKAKQLREITRSQQGWTLQIENNAMPAFGDMHINGLKVNPEKWKAIIEDTKAQLAKSIEALDAHFLPIVGEKILPMLDEAVEAHKRFKDADNPTPEEQEITARIKALVGKDRNPELKAQLTQQRAELQEQRKNQKAQLKAYHKEVSAFATKGYQKEVAKFEGQAAINYGAWQQVLAALYKSDYGFDSSNLPNLNAKTTLIKFMDLPIIRAYVDYKKFTKRVEGYGYRWITTSDKIAEGTTEWGFVDPDTGRIHTSFRQLGADTGRPSATDPNIYNLPRDPLYREPFEARDGYMMVTKDCSGQELRNLADYSHEPSWIDAFLNDKDVHSISTHMIRKEEWEAGALPNCAYFTKNFQKCKCPKHKELRDKYKAVTLGLVMGKQAYSLGIELGIPTEEAQVLIDEWFTAFPYNKATIDHNQNHAYEVGEARTRSGRRRLARKVSEEEVEKAARERYGNNWKRFVDNVRDKLIAAVKRELGNVPYQGTAADHMKLAMGCGFDPDGNPYPWHILEPYFGAMLENYIYDEFVVEVPERHAAAVGGTGEKFLGGVISDAIIRAGAQLIKAVPMASEGAIAKTWTK